MHMHLSTRHSIWMDNVHNLLDSDRISTNKIYVFVLDSMRTKIITVIACTIFLISPRSTHTRTYTFKSLAIGFDYRNHWKKISDYIAIALFVSSHCYKFLIYAHKLNTMVDIFRVFCVYRFNSNNISIAIPKISSGKI